MRNGGDIVGIFLFLCFAATVSVCAIGGHAHPAHPAGKHSEDRMTMKQA
jgi:hypothetical protein